LEKIAMISFGTPPWLWGLLAFPALALLFGYAERTGARKLRDFIAPRLLPQLTGSIHRGRRVLRFGLQLLGLGFALISLAQPRWGYAFEDVQRKGIDLLIAVDTSRSMLSNDVQPNRLERVKLAAQDLISQLQGDRIGLIAFAGRAFLQAPLTIDYDAVVESINDLDTKTIPEGGTNISDAISLAASTYGKSAVGNRALVIFTDGEELTGNAVKTAKAAADAGIKIFTVGVGTPQGSLIPITGEEGGTAFVKDTNGQVVKSKLDEKRLHEIAEATGGIYLQLQNGPRTMRSLFTDGLSKLNPKEMDVRLSRRPIERYEWPLAATVVALSASILMRERKRAPIRHLGRAPVKLAAATAAVLVLLIASVSASVPGLDLYRNGKYDDAYRAFQDDLKNHPDSPVRDKMQFDAGAAAYKMRDYDKAAEAFSQALLTKDKKLQEDSHYNMGRTLEERADMGKSDEESLSDLQNAQSHYQDTLKLDPNNPGAKANLEQVKKKIENLKKKRRKKPTPPPQQQQQKKQDKKDDQSGGGGGQSQQNKQQQSSQQNNQQKQQQSQSQSQQQNQSGQGENKQPQSGQDKSQAKNDSQPNQQPQAGQSPSPSPQEGQASASPSASPSSGEQNERKDSGSGQKDQPPEASPSPGENENKASPSPSPGKGEGSDGEGSPSPGPSPSPQKKFAGDIKGTNQGKPDNQNQASEMAQVEPEKEGEMSERQARALLESMKDEEARVQLNERRATRHVYNDW
jgi:Ca-activated chloride channel family protein